MHHWVLATEALLGGWEAPHIAPHNMASRGGEINPENPIGLIFLVECWEARFSRRG
jgi:hypothetical protein